MDDLIARLTAAIEETERVAREATEGPWKWVDPGGEWKQALVGGAKPWREGIGWRVIIPSAAPDVYPSKFDAAHIKRHGPDIVLRGCAADRKLIARGGPFCDCYDADRPPMDPATKWTVPIPHHYDCASYEAAKIIAERYGLEVQGG